MFKHRIENSDGDGGMPGKERDRERVANEGRGENSEKVNEVEVRLSGMVVHLKGEFEDEEEVGPLIAFLKKRGEIPRGNYRIIAHDRVLPESAKLKELEKPTVDTRRLFLFKI